MKKLVETRIEKTITETIEIGYDDIIEFIESKGIETENKTIIIENARYDMDKYEEDNKMIVTLKYQEIEKS